MNKWKVRTYIVIGLIVLIVFAILVYDVFAIMGGGTEASISSIIISASYKMPFMVYIIGLCNGILIGHLFWRMKKNGDTKKIDKMKKKGE